MSHDFGMPQLSADMAGRHFTGKESSVLEPGRVARQIRWDGTASFSESSRRCAWPKAAGITASRRHFPKQVKDRLPGIQSSCCMIPWKMSGFWPCGYERSPAAAIVGNECIVAAGSVRFHRRKSWRGASFNWRRSGSAGGGRRSGAVRRQGQEARDETRQSRRTGGAASRRTCLSARPCGLYGRMFCACPRQLVRLLKNPAQRASLRLNRSLAEEGW